MTESTQESAKTKIFTDAFPVGVITCIVHRDEIVVKKGDLRLVLNASEVRSLSLIGYEFEPIN